MRAVVIPAPGGPEVLRIEERPAPEPGGGQVRVRVRAAGLNRADLLQRRGHYPPPPGAPADIPGLEYAGTVERVGSGCRRWRAGDRVMGLVGGGAFAEHVVVHEDEAVRVPDAISLEDAAAVPEAFITAHDALFTRARLRSGERVLIHAVGSGVGQAAVQLAAAAGAETIGTARSEWKLERAKELGLHHAVSTDGPSFAERLRAVAGDGAVDVVLELVGGDYLHDDLRVIARLGRIVLVGLVAGRSTELDLGTLLSKRATIVGTVLRSRSLEEKIDATRAFERDVLPLLESGRVRPTIDAVLPMQEIAGAHARMERNENFGKLVLRWE